MPCSAVEGGTTNSLPACRALPRWEDPLRGFFFRFHRSRIRSRRRWSSSSSNSLMATSSALSRSGASTEPRYSPRLRMMMTRQLRSLAAVDFFLVVFIGDRNSRGLTALHGVAQSKPESRGRRLSFDSRAPRYPTGDNSASGHFTIGQLATILPPN